MLIETMVVSGLLGAKIIGDAGWGFYSKKKLDERLGAMEEKFVTKDEFKATVTAINSKSDEILNILKQGMAQPAPAQPAPVQAQTEKS